MQYAVVNQAARIGRATREVIEGEEYLRAPVTMLRPGVLNGSQGPLLYPPDEVGKDVDRWIGLPVTLNHPYSNGVGQSASEPGVWQRQGIGWITAATFLHNRLAGEVLIDVAKANALDPRIVPAVLSGPVEVSTGLMTVNVEQPGVHTDGREYRAVATSYTPDHLALLLDVPGACSVNDGCGLNLNSPAPQPQRKAPKMKTNHNCNCQPEPIYGFPPGAVHRWPAMNGEADILPLPTMNWGGEDAAVQNGEHSFDSTSNPTITRGSARPTVDPNSEMILSTPKLFDDRTDARRETMLENYLRMGIDTAMGLTGSGTEQDPIRVGEQALQAKLLSNQACLGDDPLPLPYAPWF